MHSHSIDDFRHTHVFLGETHERNERKMWTVIAICAAMMAAEIFGGFWLGSVALIADGLHMSTHAGALLIAALAYTFARRYANHGGLNLRNGESRGSGRVHKRDHIGNDRIGHRLRESDSIVQSDTHRL